MTNSSSDEEMRLADEARAKALVTRDQGRELLDRAVVRSESARGLYVDLEGAEALSPSFADEFFGGLWEHLGDAEFRARVKILNASETWKLLIGKVLAHRRARPKHASRAAQGA